MALINVSAEFSLVVPILERIANALERLAGPMLPDPGTFRKRGPESIITYGDEEKIWTRENLQKIVHEKGLAPEREKAQVDLAMRRWQYEQKNRDPNEAEEEL